MSIDRICFSHWLLTALLVAPVVADDVQLTATTATASVDEVATWPQWRGPSQQGIAPNGDLPSKWSEETASKIQIPGNGGSTPVVAGDRAYLTSGVEGANTLMAIDLNEKKIAWQVTLGDDRGNKHRKGSGSNPSPVTDGRFVVAYFRSGDLACVNADGKKVWSVNLQEKYGEDTLWWDLGSSPLLVNSMVVVPVMQTGPSYLVALDLATGELKWKADRNTGAPEEAAQSYSTPLAVNVGGREMIAVMGADTLTLNDTATGEEIARMGGFNPDAEKYFRSIASPVAEGNLIVCPYSRGATLTAVDMEKLAAGAGRDAIVWHRDDIGSDVPTPAMRDGIVYLISDSKNNKGTVSALAGQTGKTLWEVSLPRSRVSYSSSPLIAGDQLMVTGEDAVTAVVGPIGAEANAQVVSVNEVADSDQYTVASPTPADGRLLLRTKSFLYVIGE
ncbi:outer membrane biogenesis protein BamB [Neorhodopirellula pilleata]|uniref:Outer membrane biogenesis protein BamB n=2 Tax=Neorhodopirellula pilleata TaxID=2714738 RepID=A0A5C6AWE3_9BACT|nr:outer membrane biogenesis protein BamB [Neorhodopirellula pilleata]